MKLQAHQVLPAYEKTIELQQMDDRPPARAGYWLMRLQAKLEPEARALQAKRNELIVKHGEVDAQHGYAVRGAERTMAFVTEWATIANEEIEIDAPRLRIEVFGDTKMDPAHFGPLLPFMED